MVEHRLDRIGKVRASNSKASRNDKIAHHAYNEGKCEYFSRFGGEEVMATLNVRADKVEIVMDRFGDAAEISRIDGTSAKAHVRIRKSEQFFGWIAGMGKTVTIARPRSLVSEYRKYLKSLVGE